MKLAIDRKVAHHRKFRHRLDANGLLELIDERSASHARLAVDSHAQRAAKLLPGSWNRRLPGVVFLPSRVTGFSAISANK